MTRGGAYFCSLTLCFRLLAAPPRCPIESGGSGVPSQTAAAAAAAAKTEACVYAPSTSSQTTLTSSTLTNLCLHHPHLATSPCGSTDCRAALKVLNFCFLFFETPFVFCFIKHRNVDCGVVTHHTSHITHHTSPITHHTSHITHPFDCRGVSQRRRCRVPARDRRAPALMRGQSSEIVRLRMYVTRFLHYIFVTLS